MRLATLGLPVLVQGKSKHSDRRQVGPRPQEFPQGAKATLEIMEPAPCDHDASEHIIKTIMPSSPASAAGLLLSLPSQPSTEIAQTHSLEHFPSLLNRAGFPRRGRSDSSCVLAEEAGMHGECAVG
jgi:cell division septation protein DedD